MLTHTHSHFSRHISTCRAMCSWPWSLLDLRTGPARVGRYRGWKRRKTQKALQPHVSSTQAQLPLKPWWARMAPLLPSFLIMTGPRGPEQRDGKAEWGLQVRKEGTGRGWGEREWEVAEADVLFWGEETRMWPDTKRGHPSPSPQPWGGKPTRIPWPGLL